MGLALICVLAVLITAGARISSAETPPAARAAFTPPPESAIPGGQLGDAIRHGEKILSSTQVYAKRYVGNGLNCTSCHLNGGRTPDAAPLVGLWGVFPAYEMRSARVETLEDRINDCFRRSMNGRPLPLDGREMRSLLAYIRWLSQDVPTGVEVQGRGFRRIAAPGAPDPANGRNLYEAKCAACHGTNGQGMTGAGGAYLFPALWGPKSFNIGAGMARLSVAAAFVKAKMPLNQGGALSDQEAYDIAAYFIAQPRPDFAGRKNDWPKGDKPADAPY